MKIDKWTGFSWGDLLFGLIGSSGFVLFFHFFTSF